MIDTYYYYWYIIYCTFLSSLRKISLCYTSWNVRWKVDSIHCEANSHDSEWLWYNGEWPVRRNKETQTHWLLGNALFYYAENFLSRFPRRKYVLYPGVEIAHVSIYRVTSTTSVNITCFCVNYANCHWVYYYVDCYLIWIKKILFAQE